ncbi:MAG: GDP-mannose 4,6-dehydratase [Anaerolineae bacterium]
MALRALITGVSGFVGGHLAEHLLARGWEVWGCSVGAGHGGALVAAEGRFLSVDLMDPEAVRAAVAQACPEVVFHLAAQAAVAPSHRQPWETLRVNIAMQVHVLEALRWDRPCCRTVVIGSGDEYGLVAPEENPLHEQVPLRPANPYAVSKLTQDFLGLQYYLAYGLQAVRVRPFNHVGPRQQPGFVAADFAKQLAEVEAGLAAPVIHVGNLSAERDFTDVRDVVRAYELLAESGMPGEVYNIASGRAVAVADLLQMLVAECRVPVTVCTDPERLRPSDTPVFVGDYGKLRRATGWEPRIPLEQTVHDLMEYWRAQVRGRGD